MIQEVPVFPQKTYIDGQGLIGTRRWVLDAGDNLDAFEMLVAQTHWPNYRDCLPVRIESGPMLEKGVIARPVNQPRTLETLGSLPKAGKYQVIAQYELHNLCNTWPQRYPKPYHPPGTTLRLRVRGSHQYLLVTPSGFNPLTPQAALCEPGEVIKETAGSRVLIHITDYALTCDRLTFWQLDQIMASVHWDHRSGCVNADTFLGCPRGTLLFDTYQLDETRICHPLTPHRYSLTAHLRRRMVRDEYGRPMTDAAHNDEHIGWNYDFLHSGRVHGWIPINLRVGDQCVPRYPYRSLFDVLGTEAMGPADADQDLAWAPEFSSTPITDCNVFCMEGQVPNPDPVSLDEYPTGTQILPEEGSQSEDSSSSELPLCCE